MREKIDPATRPLTTSEAARLAGIGRTKLIEMFDRGRIGGFRIPGSANHRRIDRDQFRRFLVRIGRHSAAESLAPRTEATP